MQRACPHPHLILCFRTTTAHRFKRGGILVYRKGSGNTITVSTFKRPSERVDRLYSATDLATHMGLLPEIERVWIAIDHNLFLWDYVDGYVPA